MSLDVPLFIFAKKCVKANPERKSEIDSVLSLYYDEVLSGESEQNECELALAELKELFPSVK